MYKLLYKMKFKNSEDDVKIKDKNIYYVISGLKAT